MFARRQIMPLAVPTWLALIVPVTLLAGCGGGPQTSFAFGGHFGAITDEFQSILDAFESFQARADATPDVAVRIVNDSEVLAMVHLNSGIEGPAPEDFGEFGMVFDSFPFDEKDLPLYPLSREQVLVEAGGTAAGAIRCGDTIAISILAPLENTLFLDYEEDFGLYAEPGNVALEGLGTPGEMFTGDTLSTVRYIRPASDGVDCTADTLTIRIESGSRTTVYDPESGALVAGADVGRGTVDLAAGR